MTTPDPTPDRKKPHPDFVLYKHKSGQWAKRILGRLRYFGSWRTDPDGIAAVQEYQRRLPWLLKGREPPEEGAGRVTVRNLVNLWLTKKEDRANTGEIAQNSFRRYKRIGVTVIEHLGGNVRIGALHDSDLERLRESMAESRGPQALLNDLILVRGIFSLGRRKKIVPRHLKIRSSLRLPPTRVIRSRRNARKVERIYQPHEIRALLDAASVPMRAMILLAINCGMSNTDCALLRADCLKAEPGWLNLPREKTGIMRRIPLWKETEAAIRAAVKARPTPKKSEWLHLAFLNAVGGTYVANRNGDAVSREFRLLKKQCGLTTQTFYDLRRNFKTIGKRAKEPEALRAIMGHTTREKDMDDRYDLAIDDAELRKVVQVVHDWLFDSHSTNPKRKSRRQ